jgi:hypothetical protein
MTRRVSSAFPVRPDHQLPPPPVEPPPLAPAPRRRPLAAIVALAVGLAIAAATVAPVLSRTHQLAETSGHAYSFILSDPQGRPFRWNPCAPIHYVENLQGAPEGSADDIRVALGRVSAATGLTFVDDGPSQEVPTLRRDVYQPARYGERWAPVLIAWVLPSQTDISFERNGETASGVASPELPEDQMGEVYVSGWVAINAADLSPTGFGSYGDQGPILQHELSHVVGMGHTKQWGELMQPSGGGVEDYGPGDLAGLKLLGHSQGCLVTPAPPGS